MTVETATKRRGPIEAEIRPPGPIYLKKTTIGTTDHCRTYPQAAAFSIGLKRRDVANLSPGPGYSYDSHMTHRGVKDEPSFSLSGRPPTKSPYITPGPGAYDLHRAKEGALSTEHRPLSISMGQRTLWPFKREAPPPNRYRVRTGIGSQAVTERASPAYTMRPSSLVGTTPYTAMKANNPGPGSYPATEPGVYKRTSGAVTIQGRTKLRTYNTVFDNPGPGAYDPDVRSKSGNRGFTLGVRHSQYTMPFISDMDII